MTDDYWGPPEDDLERLRAHNLELELGLDEADQEAGGITGREGA